MKSENYNIKLGKTSTYLSIEYSNMLKGIGILLMLITHMWVRNDWFLTSNTYMGINLGNHYLEEYIGIFAGIVVSLYIFITGYAMHINTSNFNKIHYRIKKGLTFLTSYWVIAIFFILVALFIGESIPSFPTFLANLFGLKTGPTAEYINVCFAWYVRFYLCALILYPTLKYFSRFNFLIDCAIAFIIFYILKFIYYHTSISELGILGQIIHSIVVYMPFLILGYLTAHYKIFELIKNKLSHLKRHKNLLYVATLVIIVVLRSTIPMLMLDLLYTPILIFCIIEIMESLKQSNKLNKVYSCNMKFWQIMCKHSMNMWFLHSIFFTPTRKLQWIAFLPKVSILIIAWIILIMLPISKLLSYAQNFIGTYIDKFLSKKI